MRPIILSIFPRRGTGWVFEFHPTAKFVRSMAFVALVAVLSACVETTTSSTINSRVAPSTTIQVVASSFATSVAPSTTIEVTPSGVLTTTYEAVFLRLEVIDEMHEVVVVGVDPHGAEREIARLPGAWVAFAPDSPGRYLRPLGAVSPTGLLAMPSWHPGSEPLMMQWEIFDLLRSDEAPVIIDGVREHVDFVENTPYYEPDPRPGAFWGPGERLALAWGQVQSGLVSFVEGRTGAVTTVRSPVSRVLVPAWASDGSGVFISGGQILRPDGTRTESATVIREDSCKRQFESGAAISLPSAAGFPPLACLAPDDSMIVFNKADGYFQSSSGVLTPGDETWVEIEGSFAGWMDVGS